MLVASGLCGVLSGFFLTGWRYHGTEPAPLLDDLHWRPLVFTILGILFPIVTASLLRARWWLPPVVYSALLLLLVSIAVNGHGQWSRLLAAAGITAAAFITSGLFAPKVK